MIIYFLTLFIFFLPEIVDFIVISDMLAYYFHSIENFVIKFIYANCSQ